MSSLAFFRPEFFWALFFIAVIILLHLLRRPRLVQLNFSTLRFFQSAAVTSSKYRNIRKLLQLLFRIFAACLIIILFARPFNPGNVFSSLGNPQVSTYVWVDNTFSMEYRTLNGSLSEQAARIVDSLYRMLPSTGKVYLFDHGSNEFRLYGQQTKDSPGKIDIRLAVEEFNKSKDKNSSAVLVICSDFQASSCSGIDSALSRVDHLNPILLVSLTPKSPWNYTVGNVNVSERTVGAKLFAHGKSLEAAKVTIIAGDMSYGGMIMSVKKDASESLTVETGIHQASIGYVKLEADDPMQFDNIDYFSSDDKNAFNVTIVGNKQKNFVIGAALQASGSSQWKSIVLRSEADVVYDELDSSDLVIVNALEGPSRALDAFLSTKGNPGRSVVFCVGSDDSSLNWYQGLLARAFPDQSSIISKKNVSVFPVLPDTISSIWRKFPAFKIEEATILKYVSGFQGEVLLKFNNGDPFVWSAKDRVERNWIVFSTAIGVSAENNIYQTGFFVPLIDRLTHFLILKNQASIAAWGAGELHRNPNFSSRHKVNVFDSQGKFINDIAGQQFISFKDPGIYRIAPEGELPILVKVRPDSLESMVQYSTPMISKQRDRAVVVVDKDNLIESVKNRAEILGGMLPWMILIGIIISEVLLWRRPSEKLT
jgi:hypothetical protein